MNTSYNKSELMKFRSAFIEDLENTTLQKEQYAVWAFDEDRSIGALMTITTKKKILEDLLIVVELLIKKIKNNKINEIDNNIVLSKLKILTFRMKLNCNQFYMLSGDKIKTNEYKDYYRILLKNLYKILLY